MKKSTIFAIASLLIGLFLFEGSAYTGNPLKKKQHEPSGVNATTWPAIQDSFCGVTFGCSYERVISKVKRKYKTGVLGFGVKHGVNVSMFDFGGSVWETTTFYTKPKIGFYRIIMSLQCRSEGDAETTFVYFRGLIQEKYGDNVMITEDGNVFYKDLNDRSILLSRKGLSVTLAYSDDILSGIEHTRVINEI